MNHMIKQRSTGERAILESLKITKREKSNCKTMWVVMYMWAMNIDFASVCKIFLVDSGTAPIV
jgi:hypothetical protein